MSVHDVILDHPAARGIADLALTDKDSAAIGELTPMAPPDMPARAGMRAAERRGAGAQPFRIDGDLMPGPAAHARLGIFAALCRANAAGFDLRHLGHDAQRPSG